MTDLQQQIYKNYCDELAEYDAKLRERFPQSNENSRRQACRDLWHDKACWGCRQTKGYDCPKSTYNYWRIDKFECDVDGHLYPRVKPCRANPHYEAIIAQRRAEIKKHERDKY